MSAKKIIIMALLALAAILMCLVFVVVAIIGIIFGSDGCFYRYNFKDNAQNTGGILGTGVGTDQLFDNTNGTLSNTSLVTKSVILKASGDYSSASSGANDTSSYGKWLNTGVSAQDGQEIKISVSGEVSLCKAYLPINNIQSDSNQDVDGNIAEIPRVEGSEEPLPLIFDAQNREWRNIAELYEGDKIQIVLKRDHITSSEVTRVYDALNKTNITADCREGNIDYNPICGRYYSWDTSNQYVSNCQFVAECYECNTRNECITEEVNGVCVGGFQTVSDWCSCYDNQYGVAPEAYLNNGTHTYPWSDDLGDLRSNLNRNCRTERDYVEGAYQNQKYFWYSANNAAGLLYQFSGSPSTSSGLGENYEFAAVESSLGTDKVVLETIYEGPGTGYLQYYLYGYENNVISSGGYVLGVKQSKCRRSAGQSISDNDFNNRGQIEYVITSSGSDPESASSSDLTLDDNGHGTITANGKGSVWLKIRNKPEDYPNSSGQYSVDLITEIDNGDFGDDILTPFIDEFRQMMQDISTTIFRNMTCFNGANAEVDCQNFFSYLRAMLILYVMSYGMMFLMGMVKISQTDLVTRVIKIGLVAGLMNEGTFEFFNLYVFDVVTNFTDEIIANIGGFSLQDGGANVGDGPSNPIEFMTDILTRMILNPTFASQMMALPATGPAGIVYFVLLFIPVVMLLIVLFRAITIYLIAFMALAVLMGMAPLFLSFILFEKTRSMFTRWVQFSFQYMLEPVVLLGGVIVLTNLIVIFMDLILSYSVCWKCAVPLRLPFAAIDGVLPEFLGVDLFCINWFAPWGFDHRSFGMGLNLQYIVIVIMLTYCLWSYADFCNTLVQRITGSFGIQTATDMGQQINNKMEQTALKGAGLDAASRAKITGAVKENLGSQTKRINSGAASLKAKGKRMQSSAWGKAKDAWNKSSAEKKPDAPKAKDNAPNSNNKDK
ncbi:MAG: hypothetical protein DGJ47_000982 [Rickettsiaceae bacterium]